MHAVFMDLLVFADIGQCWCHDTWGQCQDNADAVTLEDDASAYELAPTN